jgi:hypothetical protein
LFWLCEFIDALVICDLVPYEFNFDASSTVPQALKGGYEWRYAGRDGVLKA